MSNPPDFTDQKKIRQQLRRCERELQREEQEHGFCRDGAGTRYFLGPLYMLLGDVDGALDSFRWFDSKFPDDIGEPGQYLCWTLALHRAGLDDEAERKLRRTAMSNLYVIPHLLGEEPDMLEVWHGSNREWPSYVDEIPEAYFALWTDDEKAWARVTYRGSSVLPILTRWVEIQGELDDLPPGPRRSALVDEAAGLAES